MSFLLSDKLTRKCVDRTVESGFNNACNKRKQIGPTLASMHCICEGAHYCNDWTLNSIKQRYYTETTTLDQANALNSGDSYPPYTGPLEGVPADKQKRRCTRALKQVQTILPVSFFQLGLSGVINARLRWTRMVISGQVQSTATVSPRRKVHWKNTHSIKPAITTTKSVSSISA